MSPRIHSFISGDNQWNERAGRVQDFLVLPLGVERFSFNIPRALKKYRECALELGVWGVAGYG